MTEPAAANDEPIIEVEDFSFFYGSKQVLFNIGMTFETNRVTALIGPSGCGKSTLLRNINRMNDLVPDVRHQGDIRIDGTSLYEPARGSHLPGSKRVGWSSRNTTLSLKHLRKHRLSPPCGLAATGARNWTKPWNEA